MPVEQYAIKAGYNQSAVSLVNIETIVPGGDIAFYTPAAYWDSEPGVRRTKLTGFGYYAGFAYVEWLFDVLTQKQRDYAMSTWCSGGLEGFVTINTRVGGMSYARYNAVLSVLPTKQMRRKQDGNWFEAGVFRFTHLVAL
jgi:hypothetical protein